MLGMVDLSMEAGAAGAMSCAVCGPESEESRSSLVDGGWNGGSIDGGKSCRSDERECGGGGFRNSIFRVC